VDQQPVYDKLILEDIRPTDGWILNVKTGTFDAFSGTEHTLDRFNHVFPDTTKVWNKTQAGNCLGTPCDKTEHCIGWGATRLTYYLEEQSWNTPLLCYDQEMHITKARENFRYIISDILKPATQDIQSSFLRKRHLLWAKKKWVANKDQDDFTYVFNGTGDNEIFFDCSAPPSRVKKLTPQMLQRRVQPLLRLGYAGKNPFRADLPPMIELVTDMDTCWELDKLGGQTGIGGTPSIAGNWRFEQWDAANKYWRYGFNGQIGNYMVRADWAGLRFNYVKDLGAGSAPNRYRYQVVLPYVNVASSGAGGAAGLKSEANADFDKALFGISQIHHKAGMEALVADATPVNPEMPFSSRNFGGRWQFVMDNLGADQAGRAVENKRRNKGQFIADFKQAIRPLHTEFMEAIFHKREPQCVIEIDTCATDPGYPSQSYGSCNVTC
jgi:hypothetical protein